MNLALVTNNAPLKLLTLLYSYCGVKDPSWAEVRHFVSFLDLQLQSCEQSYFCNEDFVSDVMAGLKSFIVKFMIRMSMVSVHSSAFQKYYFHLVNDRTFHLWER